MSIASLFAGRGARLGILIPFAALLCGPSPASATAFLGSAQSFAVLGASGVTNTGNTTIYGDVGTYPTVGITGTSTISITGSYHNADAVAQLAQTDSTTAFNALAALPFTTNLTGHDLGTVGTLTPGVYFFSSSAQLTGTLTLDYGSTPNAPFVFQIGSTLTTASGAAVDVLHGGANSGVYWEIGSSATLGSSTAFAGNILASKSISFDSSASIVCGRAIALTGAVTMIGNTISNNCVSQNFGTNISDYGSAGFSGSPTGGSTSVPEPGSALVLAMGLVGLATATTLRARAR